MVSSQLAILLPLIFASYVIGLLSKMSTITGATIDPKKAMQFFAVVGRLKNLKRTGWVNHGIHLPESVADHMYRMSMMSFMITDPTVSKDKLMKICMVHDLAEAIVGDITPYDGITKEDKRRMEEDALKAILADVGAPEIEQEIYSLWMDYEEGTSTEAQLARELDKLEMIVQANEYERQQPGQRLESFFTSTQTSFTHPEVLAWAQEARQEHHARFASDTAVKTADEL